jgi:hypothetical protein
VITKTLQQEFFERVSFAIREALPSEQQPEEFAAGLTAIALAHDVTVEEACRWLRDKPGGKKFTLLAFTRHATDLEQFKRELAEHVVPASLCQDCGHQLLHLGHALMCPDCGWETPA